LFQLVGQMQQLPFDPADIIKVHRGMNMVKVSVGEHLSEPSEVYIATVTEGDKLSTNVVFFLVEPKVRTLYGFEGNPYESSNRIEVETEAREFVEEMGAILEDIGWETMSEEVKGSWLDQQFLFPAKEELQIEQPVDDPGDLVEVVVEAEVEAAGEGEGVETEGEVEVEEQVILLDTDVEILTEAEILDEAAAEAAPEETTDTAPVKKPPTDPPEKVPDDTPPEKTAEAANDAQLKRQTGESLEKADGKIVFVEEKFDEMLKQAFLIPPDDPGDEEESKGEKSEGVKTEVAADEPVLSPDGGTGEEEAAGTGDILVESPSEDGAPGADANPEHQERSSSEIILRFLSKM
jgi:hypothetical protein